MIESSKIPGLHEPKYLDDLKLKVGFYDLLDVQIKGHDFVVLEKYQSYLHKTMRRLGLTVIDSYSLPSQELKIDVLADRSTAIETNYTLMIYERNLRLKNAPVTKVSILVDLIQQTSPAGVSFSIDRFSDFNENRRYFKDSVLEKLREEYQELKETPLIGS